MSNEESDFSGNESESDEETLLADEGENFAEDDGENESVTDSDHLEEQIYDTEYLEHM